MSHGSLLLPLGLGCLKPIQIVYVPMVSTPLKKCPDLPYINTDTNEAKYELNIAVYYYGIMSVNINWKELCNGISCWCHFSSCCLGHYGRRAHTFILD